MDATWNSWSTYYIDNDQSNIGVQFYFDGNEGQLTTDYNLLLNKPTLFSGSFNDLTNTPTTLQGYGITDSFTGDFNDLSNIPSGCYFSGSFNDLVDKPIIPLVPNRLLQEL